VPGIEEIAALSLTGPIREHVVSWSAALALTADFFTPDRNRTVQFPANLHRGSFGLKGFPRDTVSG
jgi:hypothetical protein